MFKLFKIQMKAFIFDWRSYASFIVPVLYLLILGTLEGEARSLATVVTSSILTISFFRLKGAFDRFKTYSYNKNINMLFKISQILFVYIIYTMFIVFLCETWFIFSGYFFTQVFDIMFGTISFGDIYWNSLNWFYIYWIIFVTMIVDTAIAFFVYSISINRGNLFNAIAFSWIFLSIIMNIFFYNYLAINDSGLYYVSYEKNWLSYFWLILPNFWTNSAALKNFQVFGSNNEFIYNPFLIGNTINQEAKMFQELYIIMPWVWIIFLNSISFTNYKISKNKLNHI